MGSSLGVSRSLHFQRPTVCALVHTRRACELCRTETPVAISPAGVRSDRRGVRVHSGTACSATGAYTSGMQLMSLKAGLAILWVSAALIAGIAGNVDSGASWTVLAGLAIIPPIVMMWRWNAPPQTLSESIQEARR